MESLKIGGNISYRNWLCRFCFLLIFGSLIYYFVSHTLISQLHSPVLKFASTDLTYWVFHIIHIPGLISGNPVIAVTFDILLIGSCMLVICFPEKRFWARIFFVLYFIYFVIYNSFGMHHVHSRIGILLLSAPFLIRDEEGFVIFWQGLRYYVCYIYSSAFLWKLFRGSWLYGEQGILIIKKNLTPYIYFNPRSVLSQVYYFLFRYPVLPDILMKTGFLMEGFFILGFFTKRFDNYLFLFSILLTLGFVFMADALFFEIAFLAIVFYKNDVAMVYTREIYVANP